MSTIVISGGSITDMMFALMRDDCPSIEWNTTRMERDAFNGRFGPPQDALFAHLEQSADPMDEFRHADRQKVLRFINLSNVPAARPNWNTGGTGDKLSMKLIDIPTITVVFVNPMNGKHYAIPVDGTHRLLARKQLGLKTFRRFVVPAHLEGEYRIQYMEVQ